MFLELAEIQTLRALTADGRLLFSTRIVRLFAYGFLSVVLTLYLAQLGLTDRQIGLLLTLTLIGDAAITLGITLIADRVGRRRMLILGATLMIFAGVAFALTNNLLLLIVAAIIGTISPSGSEVGPFLSIEQATLPQTIPDQHRTRIFALYNLAGSFATALGALCSGILAQTLQRSGASTLTSYRAIVIGYGLLGIALLALFTTLSAAIEAPRQVDVASKAFMGLHRSRRVVLKLASLFMLDSFAGALIIQSLLAYWFYLRFGVKPATLGGIFFAGNILAGISALVAARVAARFGLINTMVFTHIPSNLLLLILPLMPNLALAIITLLIRYSISQMDVPTRQSYTIAVVEADERSAAAGITWVARMAAGALAPVVTGLLLDNGFFSLPFYLAGGLKIVYDLALYFNFRRVKPPEEREAS
ncbi:MAG: MFS transporter [Acidobacteriota bacterium]